MSYTVNMRLNVEAPGRGDKDRQYVQQEKQDGVILQPNDTYAVHTLCGVICL